MDVRRRIQIGGIKKTSSGGDDVIPEPIINVDNYLTIEALEDGLTASLSLNACEYCVDGDNNWKSLSTGTATESIGTGHTLSFRGNLTPNSSSGIGTFTISKKCNLKGNCMSMLFGDNAANNYSLSGKSYAFYRLFYNCANIVNVSENFLPATVLVSSCYRGMFTNCTNLINSPNLPAETVYDYSYGAMFQNCTSLVTAPIMLAKYLGDSSCLYMFYNCQQLTTAPILYPSKLTRKCYRFMFCECNKLNYIKMLATDISASSCLEHWVYNVAPKGTVVKHPDMTTLPTGSWGIPSGWTVVNDGEESGGLA